MRFTFSPKMIRSLLHAIFLLTLQVVRAVEVNVPADWATLEVPSERPASIKSMIRVLAPTEDAEVSINEMEILMSMDEAADSFVRGSAKRGFKHVSTTKVTHDGHEARHITGILTLPESEEELPIEAYVILAPDSMLTVGVTGHEAPSKINDVLGWIELTGAESPQAAQADADSTGPSIWERVGLAAVCAAAAYAVGTAISRKNKKENKSCEATGDNAPS